MQKPPYLDNKQLGPKINEHTRNETHEKICIFQHLGFQEGGMCSHTVCAPTGEK